MESNYADPFHKQLKNALAHSSGKPMRYHLFSVPGLSPRNPPGLRRTLPGFRRHLWTQLQFIASSFREKAGQAEGTAPHLSTIPSILTCPHITSHLMHICLEAMAELMHRHMFKHTIKQKPNLSLHFWPQLQVQGTLLYSFLIIMHIMWKMWLS